MKDLGTMTFTSGKFTDVTAWINKELVEFNNFYMFDAKKPYWYGYESVQPLTDGASNPNYPQPGDERYENPPVSPSTEGSNNPLFMSSSPRHVPNMNEISWYLLKGDPRLDAAGVYVFNGHLQQGRGVWFKKMEKIIADNAALVAGAGGDVKEMGLNNYPINSYNDYRSSWKWFTVFPSNTALAEDEQYDYFFVPGLGYYFQGKYQSSNKLFYNTSNISYILYEDFGGLTVYSISGNATPAVPFF